MLSTTTAARALVAMVVASLAAIALTATASGADATTTIRIWADEERVPAVTKVANAWAASKGAKVEVIQRDFGQIRDSLKTVQAETAPDVIVGAHDWVGELSANGSIVPLFPSTATKKQFPGYALNAFSYGVAVKKLYGAPVSLENIALVTNTKLAKVPANWAQLEAQALATKKKTKAAVGHLRPAGLGRRRVPHVPALLRPLRLHLRQELGRQPRPVGHRRLEPEVPEERRDHRPVEQDAASSARRSTRRSRRTCSSRAARRSGSRGPWNLDTLKKSGLSFRVSAFPQIVPGCKSAPFLGVQGFMVTKFAGTHNVESLAKDLVSNYMMQPSAQLELALANSRYPANTRAGKLVKDPQLKAFGAASAGGVPMPNIPQMNNVWGDLSAAWVRSTKGSGSIPARRSFLGASRSIAQKIG